jgi:hypothetical protein
MSTQGDPTIPPIGAHSIQSIRAAVQSLPPDQQQTIAREMRAIAGPDQGTSNAVWLIIIWAFVSVMGIAVATLCITVFIAPATGGTAPDKILTVFTTVTAFLAGLFAPSPVNASSSQ